MWTSSQSSDLSFCRHTQAHFNCLVCRLEEKQLLQHRAQGRLQIPHDWAAQSSLLLCMGWTFSPGKINLPVPFQIKQLKWSSKELHWKENCPSGLGNVGNCRVCPHDGWAGFDHLRCYSAAPAASVQCPSLSFNKKGLPLSTRQNHAYYHVN